MCENKLRTDESDALRRCGNVLVQGADVDVDLEPEVDERCLDLGLLVILCSGPFLSPHARVGHDRFGRRHPDGGGAYTRIEDHKIVVDDGGEDVARHEHERDDASPSKDRRMRSVAGATLVCSFGRSGDDADHPPGKRGDHRGGELLGHQYAITVTTFEERLD